MDKRERERSGGIFEYSYVEQVVDSFQTGVATLQKDDCQKFNQESYSTG